MLAEQETPPTEVEMWFDPLCAWTWLTSRWLTEVEQVRPITVTWSVMSLAVLHSGEEASAEQLEQGRAAWRPVRVLVAAAEAHGAQVVKPLYDEIGTRVHVARRTDLSEVLAESLAACGLSAALAEAADDSALDAAVIASHERGISLVGSDVGSPIIAIGDVAFFGPVVSPAPTGPAAGRLWDGALLVAGTPGFFELKRTRTVGPYPEGGPTTDEPD